MNENPATKIAKILVIDDSEFLRKEITKSLEKESFNVIGEASSTPEALDIMSKGKPNIVMVDLILPDINGLDLIKHFKDNFSNIYLILMSSVSDEYFIHEALSVGAIDILIRPINEEILITSINKIADKIREDSQ